MGGGYWSASEYANYSTSVGRTYNCSMATFDDVYTSSNTAFKNVCINESLDPHDVMRECCDSEEHPNSFPVILALDVTGSMGQTAINIQKALNPIMIELFESVKDVEIAIMAIGDCECDSSPIQISQFESDIRIAENLDKIYFENGGGGNSWESYTAPWYMGLKHTRLDCWKRGKKGLIITMGDEPINPILHCRDLNECLGSVEGQDIATDKLYEEASKKFDIYHICVKSRCYPNQERNKKTFEKYLGGQHVFEANENEIHRIIVDIVKTSAEKNSGLMLFGEDASSSVKLNENGEISW